ncbi:capsid protein [Fusarium poae partitivirus 2]|uniref:capsid protein n=1 Tax=Fusarium poae partitivirus 2 TaxID=1849533 RepID=UPI000848148D|nr:capsid protein [Fusarium poae partitivirus 2]BAV56300.1 capsid protein [Fusarium poae partitivirus 2]
MSRFGPRTTIPAPPPPEPIQAATDPNTPAPPNPLHDITQAINAPGNVTSNEGDLFILDTVPDHRFPLLSWLYSIPRVLQPTAYSQAPNASPASLLGYTYLMYIGLLFHNDAFQRPSPSKHARSILSDYYLATFFNSLLDLPVPAFAALDFEALRFFNHDLASNLVAIGSEAGFSFAHDFGRFFTAGTFFGLHATLATMPGNTQLAAAQLAFSKMTVARITTAPGQTVNLAPGHLFGTVMNDTPYLNWLNTRLSAILNQSEIRSMASRPNAGRIPMFAIPEQEMSDVNPYLLMMSISDDNLELLTSWIRNLASFTRETLTTSRPLRNYTQPGNPEVLRHLVFEAPPPTWHSDSLGTHTSLNPTPEPQNPFRVGNHPHTHTQFAAARNFRTRSGIPAPIATNNPLAANAAAPPSVDNSWFASLVSTNENAHPNDPVVRRRLTADGHFANTPRAVIFEPTSATESTAHHVAVITSGKIIESGDFTGTVIPTVHPRRNLYLQNTHYLSGAVLISQTRPAIRNEYFDIHNVTDEDLLRSPLGILRGYSSRLRLPLFRQGIVERALTFESANFSSLIASGATLLPNAHRAFDSTNVFLAPDNQGHLVDDEIWPIWSSYRHYNQEARQWYVLPSLRHIFGTQARTFLTDHPSRRIPA